MSLVAGVDTQSTEVVSVGASRPDEGAPRIAGAWRTAARPQNAHHHLILKEKAAAWRADPQIQEAMAASRVDQLRIPMLAPTEPVAELMTEPPDVAVTARRGFHYERLDQLALDDPPEVRG